jgi:lysophospholipase
VAHAIAIDAMVPCAYRSRLVPTDRDRGMDVREPWPGQERPATMPPLQLETVTVAGMRLRLGHLRPEGAARGTVVVLPGRAEFIEKYAEILTELLTWGFAAAILDWRGQGGSDRFLPQRDRGHVLAVSDYLADLDAFLERLDGLSLPGRFLMLAHSMGGHVGLRYLHGHPDRFVAAAMSAPMLGIHLGPTPVPVARALCSAAIRAGAGWRYAPGQRDVDLARYVFARNRLTSSPERYEELRRHIAATPELALGGVTYGWLGAALDSIAFVQRPGFLESITTPILILQAGRERIVSNRAEEVAVRRLPAARLAVFPEARHELLQERDEIRNPVLESIRAFFDEVSPAG